METSLEYEDLLIKLRAKLNENKIKLWEPPYISETEEYSQSLKDLSKKYSEELKHDENIIIQALFELQLHSIERSKANNEFKQTGYATLRVKATVQGEKPRMLKIMKQLDVSGDELIEAVANLLEVAKNRVKLIYNGKLIRQSSNLEEQGIKNGVQIMALVMAEAPEQIKKEDKIYREMKSTLDDATLLSEYVDDIADDEEYMKLEDQSGKAIKLPPAERRSLLIGLALHERGRAAARKQDYSLALVLFLEADRQFSECRSSILQTVDNIAVLQLDISWCYLCLRSLASAGDAAARLARAENAFRLSYGEDHQRLIALKGTNANERVLFMRLYLLQGIVAYHQNKRDEARVLLEKAENELRYIKVDEASVEALTELGWSRGQARTGLRAAGGDLDRAHHYLEEKRAERETEREKHRAERLQAQLGTCLDGSSVNPQLVQALQGMGYTRRMALLALRNSNNSVADAVRLIQEHPEMLVESDSDDATPSSDDSLPEPDNKLIAELESMGYPVSEARSALRLSRNNVSRAVEILHQGCEHSCEPGSSNPSTSAGVTRKKQKKASKLKKKKDRESALHRLQNTIRSEDDEYLSGALNEEEAMLGTYRALL
ncbi:hypothetical protein KGM_213317 [Danaus plexippus plexippus]|uniref:Uncharacterized protein n=1 Tax=Danaus plexippus plexippus TaxID=278856 RepID=A0A212FGU8_DANPL|nr:hypothetical protein KGM_213317 [Danaus plexippus plexippus]